MYKKHGRHDIEAESANSEEQFASQFFNFMRKHLELIISQVSIPQINLKLGTAMPFGSASSEQCWLHSR
jgi:hypothetical protein